MSMKAKTEFSELLVKALQNKELTKKEQKKKEIELHNKLFYERLAAKNKKIVGLSEFVGLAQALRECIDDLDDDIKLKNANMRKALELFDKDLLLNDDLLYAGLQNKKQINTFENVMHLVKNIRLLVKCFFFLDVHELEELSFLIKEYLTKKKILKDDELDYSCRTLKC